MARFTQGRRPCCARWEQALLFRACRTPLRLGEPLQREPECTVARKTTARLMFFTAGSDRQSVPNDTGIATTNGVSQRRQKMPKPKQNATLCVTRLHSEDFSFPSSMLRTSEPDMTKTNPPVKKRWRQRRPYTWLRPSRLFALELQGPVIGRTPRNGFVRSPRPRRRALGDNGTPRESRFRGRRRWLASRRAL
ncbi:hypothetical protein HPB50_004687 [Hyalomma asiaticum]|uniref:Uncharacterized protein n=1 Tax=Hyalomma asiaticum TaxID=266040 RepID=A0ACB7SRS4_HYAAI|nr:hypothetical protein HPB50_004687 [Hyalomma asiaticum]